MCVLKNCIWKIYLKTYVESALISSEIFHIYFLHIFLHISLNFIFSNFDFNLNSILILIYLKTLLFYFIILKNNRRIFIKQEFDIANWKFAFHISNPEEPQDRTNKAKARGKYPYIHLTCRFDSTWHYFI